MVIAVTIRVERPDTRQVKEVQLRVTDNWSVSDAVAGIVDNTWVVNHLSSLWAWGQGWTHFGNLETKNLV